MIELLMVIAILAIAVSLVTLALPDGEAGRLEEEGARLGACWRWRVPKRGFRAPPCAGCHGATTSPPPMQTVSRCSSALSACLRAETAHPLAGPAHPGPGHRRTSVVLGPEAILPPQRIVLSLEDRRLELASDGLGPFAVAAAASAPP
jgi:general secretion pathway protein H